MATPGFPARIHFPDGTVDRIDLTEIPQLGKTVSLRSRRWLYTEVQLTAGPDDADEGIPYDVKVEAVEEDG